jgi:hypothetical protein
MPSMCQYLDTDTIHNLEVNKTEVQTGCSPFRASTQVPSGFSHQHRTDPYILSNSVRNLTWIRSVGDSIAIDAMEFLGPQVS